MNDLELRKPEDCNQDDILRIFAENDPARADFFNKAYYEWQFNQIPGKVVSLIGAVKDKVVAFGALLPFSALINGEVCTIYEGAEFVVSPEFRGQEIFTRLAKELYESIDERFNAFAFASPMSYHAYETRLGHRLAGYFPYWVGLTDIQELLKRKKAGGLGFLLVPLELRKLSVIHDGAGMSCELIRVFDSKWDIVKSWKRNDCFHLVKESAYLNWRYIDHPCHRYDILGAYKYGQPSGYIVLRGQNLIDLAYADIDTMKFMLNAALEYFREKKVLMAHMYLNLDHEGLRIIKSMHFWRCNIFQGKFARTILYPVQRAMVKTRNSQGAFPELDSWTFTMGDMDCKL